MNNFICFLSHLWNRFVLPFPRDILIMSKKKNAYSTINQRLRQAFDVEPEDSLAFVYLAFLPPQCLPESAWSAGIIDVAV